MLHLYDSATRQTREVVPRDPGALGIYVCGPTVYGPPHIGHGRFGLEYDILARYLRWSGLAVRFVSNVTDIDDKIIDRAAREDRPWQDIAQRCEHEWFSAMDRLDVLRPDDIPHATAYVDEMVAMIGELVDSGHAYVTDDGVYLSVETVEGYGLLAQQSLDEMLEGGGERDLVGSGGKRSPADFSLWKLAKPGEPSWPSPWGDGRPGWHTECVVMSLDLLGEGFDIHGGGLDLRFPHHENERAQAVALGKRSAALWMHNGFVVDDEGEKMSKSLANFDNLFDLLDQFDGRVYRLLMLQSHYRSPVRVTGDSLGAAQRALAGLDVFSARMAPLVGPTSRDDADPEVIDRFVRFMDDDLDTPRAMALVFDIVRSANGLADSGETEHLDQLVAAVREMTGALGLVLGRTAVVPDEVAVKAAALDAARATKHYDEADAIRAELQGAGWIVETTGAGTTVRR